MDKNKKLIIVGLIVLLIIGIAIVYKLIEKSIIDRENFEFKVENISRAPVNTIENEQNEKEFLGKVIESNTSYIIVEPNETEEERKSSDRIYIKLDEANDEIYMVGTNVKITYDGSIMESYPAQIKAIKVELK